MSLCNTDFRLQGFTILELLAGMIATSIVIAAMFSAYHIINVQSLNYKEKSNAVAELSLFHSRITKDFNETASMEWSEATLVFRKTFESANNSIELPMISYEFHDEYTLRRTGEHADTFKVDVQSHPAFNNGTLEGLENNPGEVRITFGKENNEIILRKWTDAKTMLRTESDEWMK